jgi:hypothetical protein
MPRNCGAFYFQASPQDAFLGKVGLISFTSWKVIAPRTTADITS